MLACRQIIDGPTVESIADAHLYVTKSIQNIQFRQGQSVNSINADGLPHQNGIEPPAAARPSRDGTEFATALANGAADLVVLLGRERPSADTRGIGLADTEYIADCGRTKARAGGRLGRHRIGRGHEGISAVVDIEQRPLCALEQNAPAFPALAVEQ